MPATVHESDDLIRRAASGEEAAFEILIRPELLPAYRLAVVLLDDPTAAEDALQEATFKAWRHLGRLRPGTDLRAWFLTVVANQCRSERRARWWRVLRGLERAEAPAFEPDVAGWDIEQALLGLSVKDRAALFLRFYEDLTLREVARVLGISMTAARSRVHRALRRMRLQLEPEGHEHER
jgi:RNA polymerase sigma-70 factor, ECF subfamily